LFEERNKLQSEKSNIKFYNLSKFAYTAAAVLMIAIFAKGGIYYFSNYNQSLVTDERVNSDIKNENVAKTPATNSQEKKTNSNTSGDVNNLSDKDVLIANDGALEKSKNNINSQHPLEPQKNNSEQPKDKKTLQTKTIVTTQPQKITTPKPKKANISQSSITSTPMKEQPNKFADTSIVENQQLKKAQAVTTAQSENQKTAQTQDSTTGVAAGAPKKNDQRFGNFKISINSVDIEGFNKTFQILNDLNIKYYELMLEYSDPKDIANATAVQLVVESIDFEKYSNFTKQLSLNNIEFKEEYFAEYDQSEQMSGTIAID
jgi:ribosomal protein L14E/L6E/L27E